MCITGKNFQFWFESPPQVQMKVKCGFLKVVVEGMGGVEASN